MHTITGKTAVVTGAGSGIGRATALALARKGAAIALADIDEAGLQETARQIAADGGRSSQHRVDVADREQMAAFVQDVEARHGRIDIVVNNAWGGGSTSRLEEKTDDLMRHGFSVGVMAAFWSMQAAFPYMKEKSFGRFINLCSLNGVNAHMFTAEYNIAKEGLRALTRTAAREWARHGIVANIICPAAETAAYKAFAQWSPENAADLLQQNPMGYMGDPEEDIAPVAVFLASEDARYMTGNTLFVDGGGHINGVSWAPELP